MAGLDARSIKRLQKLHATLDRKDRDAVLRAVGTLYLDGVIQDDIATVLGISTRTVQRYVTAFREIQVNVSIAPEDAMLSDEDRAAMLEFSPDAFERFFNRYSGMDLPAHCKPWVEAFCRERNLLLQVPPRHAKSTVMSCWLPVWLIARDRNVQLIIVSKTSTVSKVWSRAISDQLILNEPLIRDFGRFAPEYKGEFIWREGSGELIVAGRTRQTKGPQLTVQARGSGTQILGMEADYVIVDDATDEKVSRSETDRANQLTWLRSEVLSRLNAGNEVGEVGRAVVIGQRVHQLDLYGALAEQKYERGPNKGTTLWHQEMYPAILRWPDEDPDNPEPLTLWPAIWPFEELMVSYERLGSAAFTCMYQQAPEPIGGTLVKPEWLEACIDYSRPAWVSGFGSDDGLGGLDDTEDAKRVRVLSIDPSPTRFNGYVLGDLEWTGREGPLKLNVLGAFRTQAGSMRDMAITIKDLVASYSPTYLIFEESGFARWYYDSDLYASIKDDVTTIRQKTTSVNKNHMEFGLQSLASHFEFQRIRLPGGDAEGREMIDALSGELYRYPDGLSDIMMALWFVVWNRAKLRPRDRDSYPSHFRNSGRPQTWGYFRNARRGTERDIFDIEKEREEKARIAASRAKNKVLA